ncbi:hypothetical protein BDZ91DRAFT_232719 [Kalaharituber pfeilii]|nr:hypothetical protein BDZ91DRAFT_232719 [Kalaharituber pfeilii]
MSSLHEAVYFDENDLDDDLSLDFDVDEPLIAPALKAAVASIPPAAGSQELKPPPPSNNVPDSSAPLPWSSSPIRQFQPMPAPTQPSTEVYLQEAVSQMAAKPSTGVFSTSTDAGIAQDKPKGTFSRRRIPWLEKTEEKYSEVSEKSNRPSAKIRERERRPKTGANAPETPHKAPNMPWNATASALKVQRQEHRGKVAVQKRSASTVTGGNEPDNLKAKKQEQPAAIFLSEEQRRVITLVKDHEKSVFFTGSAGLLPVYSR